MYSCSNTITTEAALLEWINNPENGFSKKATANGFLFSAKYLPSAYLAYAEFKKGDSTKDIETLSKEFENSMTLLFSIEHEQQGIDATNYNVENMVAYKERINQLNFDIKNHMFIKEKNGKKIKPVLTTFENSYEIGGKKTFYIVFPKNKEVKNSSETIDLVFDDTFLDTGISHFVFQKEKINQLPTLEFIN
jgi:hypothetical protein